MRIVLDTNIFISGIFWKGNFCSQIIDAWRNGKFILISSLSLIEELIENLKDFRIQMPEDVVEGWKNMIIQNSVIIETKNKLNIVEHDADNKFLETVFEGNADYIISQDNHLLKLKEFRGIKIIKPEEAVLLF